MATANLEARYTPDDLLSLEDGHRFELIDGRLVERHMGAESSRVAAILIRLLDQHAEASRAGFVFATDCGYQCFPGNPNRVRYADGSFIVRGRLPDDRPPRGHVRIAPDAAIEVVSPNDSAYEVEEKVEEYRTAGVRLLWVVYPNTRRVVVHRADGSVTRLAPEAELSGEDVLPGFRCRVADLFAGL